MFSNSIEMSEIHKVDLYLTPQQRLKYMKKLPFQMTAKQCMTTDGKHLLSANMNSKSYKELLRKVSKMKGVRFSKDTFKEGSGLFKDLMKGVVKGIAPVIIDKIGDQTNTRALTDSLLKPNIDKVIDVVGGSGFEIDHMKSTVIPSRGRPRVPISDYKLAVMPNEIVGESLKIKRLVKGSDEAKMWMASIREKKGKGIKCNGSGVFEDLGRKIKETFNPDLGRKIKDALTSDTAKKIYKEVANVAIPIIATSTGQPLLGQVAKIGIDGVLGGKLKKLKQKRTTNIKSSSSTLINGVPQLLQNRQGGSFKGL